MRLDLNAQMTGEMQELVLGSWHRILPAIPAAQREPRAGWVCRRARRAWIYFWGSACLSPGAEQHQGLLWDCRDLGRNVGKLLPSECFGAVLWLDTVWVWVFRGHEEELLWVTMARMNNPRKTGSS